MMLRDIYRLDTIKVEYSDEYTPEDIDSEVFNVLEEIKADAGFYWYCRAPYCGDGELIYLKDDKWYLYSMSHCSCYGPTEHLTDGRSELKSYDSFQELLAACTDDYKTHINPLIQLIKDKGYGETKPDDIGIGAYL